MRHLVGWLRLVRVPNLATAVADVLAGFLVASGLREVGWLPPAAGWAIAASICLYAAGMVLNDVFDLELDRRERPERALPSGQVTVGAAAFGGHVLLVAGVAAAAIAGMVSGVPGPAVVGLALAAAVWAYDRGLKRSPLVGPATMGVCRGLNWLLGMTAAAGAGPVGEQWLLPVGMGLYVAGITLFARHEADGSATEGSATEGSATEGSATDGSATDGTTATRMISSLGAGAAVMVAGLVVAALPVWRLAQAGRPLPGTPLPPGTWLTLWSIIAASVLVRVVPAVTAPAPARIQAAVGNAIMSIITLDAVLVLATCGEPWAIVVLMLLAWFVVGRRIVPPT
jgi:4-hydroxybenzoate polyprenyltransferase